MKIVCVKISEMVNLMDTLKNTKYVYECIKSNNDLLKLPDLTQEELQLILTMYTQFFQRL